MRPVKRNSEGEKVRRKDRGKMPLMEVVGGSGDRDKVRLEPVVRGGKPQYVESTNQLLQNLENMAYADEINKGVDTKISAEESAKARKKAEEEAAIQARYARLKALGYDPSVDLNAEIPESPRGYLHWDQITPGRATRALTYADAINTYPSAATQEELFQLFQSDPALAELWANSAENQRFYEAQRGAATRRATQTRQEVDRQFTGMPEYRMSGYYPWDSNPNLTTVLLRPPDYGDEFAKRPSQEFLNSTLVTDKYAPVDVHTGKPATIQPSDPTVNRIAPGQEYSTIHVWNPVDYRGEANNDGVKWMSDVTGWKSPQYVDEQGNLHPVSKQRPSMLTDTKEDYRQSRVGRFDAYMNSLMYNSPEEFNDIYGLFQVAKQELPEGMFNDFVASYIERAILPDGHSFSDPNGNNRLMSSQIGNIPTMSANAWDRMPGIVQVPVVNPDGSIGSTILNGMSLGSYIDDGIQDNERGRYFTREFTGHPTNEEAYKFFEDYYTNVQPDDRLWLTYPALDVTRPNDPMAMRDPQYIGARQIHRYPAILFNEEGGLNAPTMLLNAGNETVVQDKEGVQGAKVVKRKDLYQAVADKYRNRTFQTNNGTSRVKIWNGL
jgi:hypothetical protein